MNPVVLAILIYLAAVFVVITAVHIHQIGLRNLKIRLHLIWLAAWGNDYTQPRFDPGLTPPLYDFPDPAHAEDPVLAILLRSSEAERRWYAFHCLLDAFEQRDDALFLPDEERRIHDFLQRNYHQALQESSESIRSRLEARHIRDEDRLQERWIIEDPATKVRFQVQMADQELLRMDPETTVPPAVQQRIDTFPSRLLQRVEAESDGLQPRVGP